MSRSISKSDLMTLVRMGEMREVVRGRYYIESRTGALWKSVGAMGDRLVMRPWGGVS